MVSTLKVTKIQIPNSDSDVISLDASSGNITVPKPIAFSGTVTGTAMVKVADLDFAEGVTNVEIDSTHINSTYDSYRIQYRFKPATDNVHLRLRIFVGGVIQTGTIYAYEGHQSGGGAINSNGDSYFRLNTGSVGGAGAAKEEGLMGHIEMLNVNNTFLPLSYGGSSNHMNTSGNHVGNEITGFLIKGQEATVANGLRFYWSSGNFDGGNVKIYGIS